MPTPSTATAGFNAGVFITSTPSLSMTNEGMADSGDHQTFNIVNEAHQAWDYSQAFAVQAEWDEVQSVTITGGPTGGTWTLTFGGNTTTAIAYNAAASAVQSALQALASVGANNVSVSGSAGGPYTVEFVGSLGYAAQTLMTASGAGLTGGSSPGVNVARVQAGQTWTTQASSVYKIAYAIGQVMFNTALSGTPVVRISSGFYFPLAFLAGVNSIEGTGTCTTIDTTSQQNPPSPWKTFIAGELSATLKLGGFWVNGGLFLSHLSNNDILLLKTYPNQANAQRYQGYGVMTQDAIKGAIGGANTEEIDFQINGKFYWVQS